MKINMSRSVRNLTVTWLLIAISTALLSISTHALPEYATRTGASCATCHVSPGGAGPLTLQGLSWVADERPNVVVGFKNVLMAPGVDDAAELYEVGCAACHGYLGEGLSGSALVGYDFSIPLLRRVITDGVPEYDMPGFAGQFTPAQLEGLSIYVSRLAAGRISPQQSYPINLDVKLCGSLTGSTPCGRN